MQVIKKLLIASVLFALTPALAATPDTQRDVEGIAAIVNDKVISLFDVDQRVDLFFATSGIERSPQMRERIRSQVLRLLVDEELQMQEAERVEIKVEEEEIDNNIRRLAGESQMTIEGIREFLNGKGIEDDTLKRQIETELAWSQFVRRSFGGRLKIGEQEIEEQYKKAMRSLSEPRFKVS
jgi:peptidyl-prolyl cis-trans isomerase SurA